MIDYRGFWKVLTRGETVLFCASGTARDGSENPILAGGSVRLKETIWAMLEVSVCGVSPTWTFLFPPPLQNRGYKDARVDKVISMLEPPGMASSSGKPEGYLANSHRALMLAYLTLHLQCLRTMSPLFDSDELRYQPQIL